MIHTEQLIRGQEGLIKPAASGKELMLLSDVLSLIFYKRPPFTACSLGKFLDCGKYSGVKDLINIMSACE